MCNCSTWHNELDFECCCTCHGSSDERQNAANNHARRLCTTIARLTEELTQARTDTLREQRAVTLALDMRSAAYAERDAALSELSGVRAKAEEAVGLLDGIDSTDGRDTRWLEQALAILAPQDETPERAASRLADTREGVQDV